MKSCLKPELISVTPRLVPQLPLPFVLLLLGHLAPVQLVAVVVGLRVVVPIQLAEAIAEETSALLIFVLSSFCSFGVTALIFHGAQCLLLHLDFSTFIVNTGCKLADGHVL